MKRNSSKNSSPAKDQHFLPQFYLGKFLSPDTPQGQEPSVWVFDIRKARWRRRAPRNIAHLRHYYSFEEAPGRLVNVVDLSLTNVEAVGAGILRKLLNREQLEDREQLHFALFVAQLSLRTPRNEQRVKEMNRLMGDAFMARVVEEYRSDPALFEEHRQRYEAKSGKPLSLSVDDLDRHRPRLVANKQGVLAQMFLLSMIAHPEGPIATIFEGRAAA